MSESFLDGKVTLHRGDCLEVLPLLAENSIDSCVTDPPYHLTNNTGTRSPYPGQYTPIGQPKKPKGGFMGKQWDGGDIAFRPELWAQVFRVLKPGAHLLAFSGTRTYHRMACAIEDAGFEIRDQIGWCYGSGFPKSHDVSKGIDRMAGAKRGTDYEPNNGNAVYGKGMGGGAWNAPSDPPVTESAIQWQGWGTALKPAWEPIVLARKPLSESSIAANVLKHGTGGINVDGCRIATGELTPRNNNNTTTMLEKGFENGKPYTINPSPLGRFPANLIHDGSEEVLAGFPESATGTLNPYAKANRGGHAGNNSEISTFSREGDSGSAARFFYTAKADADDRLGSKHPTVKPLDLIQYLVRLITPRGGIVLDPFAGTGTCGEAAFREGMAAVLIEREAEYQADIVRRMGLCLAGPEERRAASVKQLPPDDLPIFGGAA